MAGFRYHGGVSDSPRFPDVSAAIIAGGKGRRMGGVIKALIEVDGQRIIDRQLGVLRPLVASLCIVADDGAPFSEVELPVIPDRVADSGPIGGIAAALEWSQTPWVLAVASDMPHLSEPTISVLLAACGEAVDDSVDIVCVDRQPLCAVYSTRCLPLLDRRLEARELRASGLLRADELRIHVVDASAFSDLDPELRFLSNINSPIDLRP